MIKLKIKQKQLENESILIWKMAVASAISWEIAKLAGSDHPYLAPLSVILCLQTTVNRSIQFSYHRMVGTVIGIVVTVFAVPHLKVNGWTIGLLILAGSFIAKWLKRDESAIHQVALTVLLVFVMEHKSGDYFIDRFRDTLIGSIVAVLLHMLFYPPNFTKQASKIFNEFAQHLTLTFIKIANWIQTGSNQEDGYIIQEEINALLKELHQTRKLLKAASDSLIFNPFGKKSRKALQHFQQKLFYLNLGYTYISSVIGTLTAWSTAGTMTNVQQALWADQLRELSHFFAEKENPAGQKLPGEILIVNIPKDLEKQQFSISLYHQTVQLLKKLTELPKNTGEEE